MQTLQGIAASPGVAIGEALIVDNEGFRIPRRFISRESIDSELHRLEAAIDGVATEIEKNRTTVSAAMGEQYGAIFSAHLMMVRDEQLRGELDELIRERYFSPEYAVRRTFRKYAQVFRDMKNAYLAERAHDVHDIERGLLRRLLGEQREQLSKLPSPVIVLAHNLTPSETATLDHQHVLGFATEIGGAGGHTSIVAKGLEIPAVVGTGSLLDNVTSGDLVIVDGDNGRVIIEPDEFAIDHYRHELEEHHSLVVRLRELRDLPAVTTDGEEVTLSANIEFPREVESCLEHGCAGIGLYRTEFLYLGSDHEPSEDDQFRAYAEVIQSMRQRPVVIRTLDLGADKLGQLPTVEEERNPFLGLRSVRLSLKNLPVFRTQLRAILRASTLGDVRLMFPLISNLQELRQCKMVLADALEDLEESGVDFDRHIQVGMMVEVPAAVIMIDRFLPEVDFISIGTNDLVQYALAVDRSNIEVADRYRASDPAVLRLLKMTLDAAHQAGVPTTVCGQMSSEPMFTMPLLGLGLRGISAPPSAIPELKNICRRVSIEQCEAVAQRALEMDNSREIETYLREQLRKAVPEVACT
jgi:phosphotransferase system enzyme I (PtsI)